LFPQIAQWHRVSGINVRHGASSNLLSFFIQNRLIQFPEITVLGNRHKGKQAKHHNKMFFHIRCTISYYHHIELLAPNTIESDKSAFEQRKPHRLH